MTTATAPKPRKPRVRVVPTEVTQPKADFLTLADIIAATGGVPPEQIIFTPLPGTATEADVEAYDRVGESYELLNGILLRKTMGVEEDLVASWVVFLLWEYVSAHDLGVVGSSQAMLRLAPGLVRMPDACYTPWASRARATPGSVCQDVPPSLIVEVLSSSNTKGDMAGKLDQYSAAGVKLVWYIDPVRKEVDVYPGGRAKSKKTFTLADTLSGGRIIPGFTLPVTRIFEKSGPRQPKKKA